MFFLRCTAVLLCLTAVAKLYSATGTVRLLSATDPLIHLTCRQVMVGAGLLEAGIAAYLLFGRSVVAKVWLVFWLGSNFLIYRSARDLFHLSACPCLGTVMSILQLTKKQTDFLLTMSVLYLFCGSLFILLAAWSGKKGDAEASSAARCVARFP